MLEIKEIIYDWNDQITFFASEQYLKSRSDVYGWIGGFEDKNLIYLLPYTIEEKLIFTFLKFHSSTIYLSKDGSRENEQEFLNNVIIYVKKKKIDFISQPSTNVVFNSYPLNSIYSHFGSYIIDLRKGEKILWENLHQKHRNVIRKAISNEIQIKRGKEFKKDCYNLLRETYSRSNMRFLSENKFIELVTSWDSNVEIFVALNKNQIQGCALFLFSKFCSYYLHGGSIEKPSLGSINLLHWEAIKYFKSLGVGLYDFVGARINVKSGTKLEGIQRFKSRFGSELKKGYLWKIPIKKNRYNLYYLLLKTNAKIRKGKFEGDIIDQEQKLRQYGNY